MIEITPIGIANIGWKLYIIFAIFNACFVPLVYLFVPETAGFSLETVDLYFMDRTVNPIKGAARMRRQIRNGEVVVDDNGKLSAFGDLRDEDPEKKGSSAQEVEQM